MNTVDALNGSPRDIQAELSGILAATLDTAMPRTVISTMVDGVLVTIVEPCLLTLDEVHPVSRGYVWHAVCGDFTLEAASVESDGTSRPGMSRGGQIIARSEVSAAAALAAACTLIREQRGR